MVTFKEFMETYDRRDDHMKHIYGLDDYLEMRGAYSYTKYDTSLMVYIDHIFEAGYYGLIPEEDGSIRWMKTISEPSINKLCDYGSDHVKEVLYVFSHLDTLREHTIWRLHVITKDDLYYRHNKEFTDFHKLEEFAIKVEQKAFINTKYWEYLGEYNYEYSAYIDNNFQEDYYYDDSEERAIKEVDEMIEADTLPDGTVPGYR